MMKPGSPVELHPHIGPLIRLSKATIVGGPPYMVALSIGGQAALIDAGDLVDSIAIAIDAPEGWLDR